MIGTIPNIDHLRVGQKELLNRLVGLHLVIELLVIEHYPFTL